MLRAVARDQKQRFETAEEMLLALERGESQPVSAPLRTPLAQRPAALWQAIAVISIVINLLLIYILLVR